ncbi:hypothetical protein [Streptomonospora salina]|uniref:Ribosomal protein L7/L12 C-terminal domain-containing protein n=1 Tax=Streptomonospora salina TaxID=104205 RepID=A0A841E6F5_9ACTN|nr:hypothetical protein [Streptomonospora salina]MBB5998034.1 hypothetical protein [Streptomonospora salina]
MSLLLMVLALLGALAVLGTGAWVAGQLRRGDQDVEPGAGASALAAPADPPAGGYTLLEGGQDRSGSALSDDTLARVRGLLDEGRGNEAAGAVRDATGCGERRAEEIVAEIRSFG